MSMEKLSTHKDGASRAHVVGGEEETDLYATKFVSVSMIVHLLRHLALLGILMESYLTFCWNLFVF